MKKTTIDSDPLWFKDAIIYELHVKSFFDHNNDGIGDFRGLTQKLDYLQSLGITCVWLLPFYESPLRDDGYDISDYRKIHPSYGNLRDFKRFVQEAHKRGIRVLIELVINHTSDQHAWFQQARQSSPGSAKRHFYVWSDSNKKFSQARVIFTDTEKSNWTWDHDAQAYYWHRFFHHQPDLNYDNPAVRREVLRVMRFWLDIGVDCLRLDAVPYLIERENTNCENLAETHAVLKGLRKEMDKSHPGRVFLAEANQWPEDVRPYFGDGDECHMAFHFPLMPRIFMALRQEDRHPITEIIRQTPSIPDNCQWALFLRNHDELTLEMVTDKERDYMYNMYATDHRMKLNMGIRRRLSPLVDHSRRRLELLNSLLFSFPGTPIIYYGDEIRMGDNMFLGDRNGVRTPMQWTGDRNAGFSRADPAKLFSPIIMDPVHGYQAINVEAQERDPSSFLQWMKRLIALRKRFKIFGRGSIEFVHSQNRKILTYIRRYEGEVVLAAANLSRFVQPVELNLSEFKGMIPVEMLGNVEFPAIGDLPYFLTLGPHAFYWFQLRRPTSLLPANEPDREWDTIKIKGKWDTLFTDPKTKKQLETKILTEFISKQRWYGGKANLLHSVKIMDWAALNTGSAPTFLLITEAIFGEGESEFYFLPVVAATGAGAEALAQSIPQAVMARLTNDDTTGFLHDAMTDDPSCQALLSAIEGSQIIKTQTGQFRASAAHVYNDIRGPKEEPLDIIRQPIEQSHTSLQFGWKMILKIYRRLQFGVNPDYEIGRFLTEKTNFERIPKTAGVIEYFHGKNTITIGLLQNLISKQSDGWTHALDELSQYFERVSTLMDLSKPAGSVSEFLNAPEQEAPPQAVTEIIGTYLDQAKILGQRTAELHMALSQNTSEPAFCPEPLTTRDFSESLIDMRKYAQNVFRMVERRIGGLPEPTVDRIHKLLSERSKMIRRLNPPKINDIPGGKIRCHGDYHLGQVLWFENDYVILDFEGEPARPMPERRAKQSPLKDVAGMLRSHSYAAHFAFSQYTLNRPETTELLEPWAKLWADWVSAVFLKAYIRTAGKAPFLPDSQTHFKAILDAYVVDKAFYEILYDLNNRPEWIHIPINGLLM